MAKDLYVLTPNGTRAEAEKARSLFGKERQVTVGVAWGHTAGQRIVGDVIVIGGGAPTIEKDATGKVSRYASWNAAKTALAPEKPEPKPDPQPEPEPEPSDAAGPGAEAEVDEFDDMNRPVLITTAAARWPGAAQWVNLSNDQLRAKMRELAAKEPSD